MGEKLQTFPLVSIIIPVYNAGAYLEKRIDSLIHQTLQDIEIIFVLDCPTDGSDQIVKRYMKNDQRIKLVIHDTNLHVGLSRNDGLKTATGEYVAFADHDDYCEYNMYEKLYWLAKQNDADIVFSDMFLKTAKGEILSKEYSLSGEIRYKFLMELLKGNGHYYSVLNHIYRRDLLLRQHIAFVDTRRITLEDGCFNLMAYSVANRVEHSSDKFLYHVLYPQSTQHSYEFKSLVPLIGYLEYVSDYYDAHPEYVNLYKSFFCPALLNKLYNSFLPEVRYRGFRHALTTLAQIKKSDSIQKALTHLQGQKYSFSLQVKCFFIILRLFYMPAR